MRWLKAQISIVLKAALIVGGAWFLMVEAARIFGG